MAKRAIRLLLGLVLITVFLFSVCACDEEHEHTYKAGWMCDAKEHWREATCGDIEIGLKGLHNFIDGVCTLCGYKDPDYVPPEEPSEDPELPGETEDPKDDPAPPEGPGSTDRPTAPDSGDPADPDDELFDDPILDASDDSLYTPKKEYTFGSKSTDGELTFTELWKDNELKGYAVSADGNQKVREISVPEEYCDRPVLMVNDNGFRNCAMLEKIYLPDGMLFIGESAFVGCSALWKVTIPSSLWLIGKRAFYGCSYLTTIALPEGVQEIRYAAFKGCAFDKINIPDSVTTISSLAFYNCMCLKELTFGSGVKSVGGQAFCNSDKLKRVNISDLKAWCEVSFAYDNSNPLYYGADLYLNNSPLREVNIPDGCKVNKYSFIGCTSIEEVTIPASAEKIGDSAFMKCSALRKVAFREGASEIGSFAFASCGNLSEVVFPDTLRIVKRDAFNACSKLTKVVFGRGISTLEPYSFTGLPNAAKFYYRGTEDDWKKVSKQSNWATGASGNDVQFDYEDP